jgi:hypothetical protein
VQRRWRWSRAGKGTNCCGGARAGAVASEVARAAGEVSGITTSAFAGRITASATKSTPSCSITSLRTCLVDPSRNVRWLAGIHASRVKSDGPFRSGKLLGGWDNVPMHRWVTVADVSCADFLSP